MPDYRFIVQSDGDTPQQGIKTTPLSVVPTDTVGGGTNAFSDGVERKVAQSAMQSVVLSPLNSATGGMATPVYQLGKGISTGMSGAGWAAAGAGAATLAIALVHFGIQKIEQRIAKMESKAEEMNNRDNALIRAGAKSEATYYKGSFAGVKTINRN